MNKKIFLYSIFCFALLLMSAAKSRAVGDITITSPSRNVSAAPDVATLAVTGRNKKVFYIPYIQTSSNLNVSASAATSSLPSGGGVKFVLSQGLSSEQSKYDMEAPFSAQFNNLSKAEYTLDVYIVDSLKNIIDDQTKHDKATRIGIGDIITAIGDSITEGFNGKMCGSKHIPDWLNVPTKCAVSKDGRNFPQYGPTGGAYKQSWMTELNDNLSASLGYPVFIMNEGVGGITAARYTKTMNKTEWANRQNSLKPNKWLIHLGVNDVNAGFSASAFKRNITSIINTLKNNYGAESQNIFIAKTIYWAGVNKYLPIINSLVNNEKIASYGPDFYNFYKKNTKYGRVHPNTAGMTQMAQLWASSIAQ